MRKGKNGVAACSIEVASWDELPDLESEDGVAQRCFGTCLRCRRDMDAMALVATVFISSAASVIKSGVAQKLVGDDSASLVTLKRDPKTGRFMKREKK